MTARSMLEGYREDIQRCMRCGFCRALCPTWTEIGWETGSPRGRMLALKGILDGVLDPSPLTSERIFDCTLCGYCTWRCPPGVRTIDVIKSARAFLVEKDCYPRILDDIDSSLKNEHNVYGLSAEGRLDWVDYLDVRDIVPTSRNAEVLYFVGCVTSYSGRAMSLAAATSKILNKLGIDWTTLGNEEWCCGDPLLLAGRTDLAKELALHNIDMIHDTGAETMVTACPGCYRTFVDEYPELVGNLGFEVMHISQFFEKLMNEGKLDFEEKTSKTAVYHDPCELGRLSEVYEPPRKLLDHIPGIRLLELAKSRELTQCCGAGGALKITNPKLSLQLALKKLEECRSSGADIIISSCPTCKLNISES
jgi:Fe-S oxidoreductase